MIVVRPTTKTMEVTLMLPINNPIIKHKAGLLNLAEELGNGRIIIIMSVPIKVKCVVGEHQWKRLRMENNSGRRK